MATFSPPAFPAALPGVLSFLGKAIAFVLILLVPLAALEVYETIHSADHIERKYQEMYGGSVDWPLIAIGSSHAVHGLVPAVLAKSGLSCYNYAYNGSGPVFHAAWLDAYAATGRHPKWLVWCVDWFSLGSGLGRRFEHDAAYLPRPVYFGLLSSQTLSTALLLANRSALWREREHLQEGVLGQGEPNGLRYVLPRYEHGFVPLEADRFSAFDPGHLPTQVMPDARAALDTLFARATAMGMRIVMVEPPEYTPLAHRHPNDEAPFAAFAASHGIPLLNYNGERASPLNEDHGAFVDWGHLSERGAATWSATLARDLVALGVGG